ncbi:nucleoside hydrolase [Candidatus Kaiserbacteria bacterium]|nr:nucleoside hydrolase [Candidatus Kaiserbacteria bacterium]
MRKIFVFSTLLSLIGCAGVELPQLTPVTSANSERVWVDMDPACGVELVHSDPDDCLAYILARRAKMNIVGISTTKGNASESDTWKIAQTLVGDDIPLYRGRGGCQSNAVRALKKAAQKPLKIMALGPLTNIAALLQCHPEAAQHITEVVFVGSRFAGERFVVNPNWFIQMNLKDLNVVSDIEAVSTVLSSKIPLRYVPFEAGRRVPIQYSVVIGYRVKLPDYLHERLRDWGLMFSVLAGSDGFLPFDAVAVAYALWPKQFLCKTVSSQLVRDELIVKIKKEEVNTRCVPKNGNLLRILILSTLSLS